MAKPKESNGNTSETTADTRSRETCLETLIRARAHEIYELRGKEDGHAEEDWLAAEAEILARALSAESS